MSELSPVAQAALDAFNHKARPEPHHQREAIAAALRAAADQVVPMALCVHNDDFVYVRSQLHAIAHELEAQ